MNSLVGTLVHSGISEQTATLVAGQFTVKKYAKGDLFATEGHANMYLGFIEKGAFHYYYNHDGEEMTTYVVGQNGFVASLSSFLHRIPSKENIQAIMPSTVYQIHKDAFDKLVEENEEVKAFYIGVLEYQILCIDNSRYNLAVLTAEERYNKMLAEEPELIQQLPVQFVASLLAITPRHLSRIRKNN